MKHTLATFAAVAALSTGAAFADAHMSNSMGEGFDMLQSGLAADFERMGIEMESIDNLTIGQLAAIKAVLEDDQTGNDKAQVEAIIANN